jgi:N-acetylglucosaminyldiphosphoundecaprenol N-acetyl-beta-D-mannosaminyltransferase
MSGAQCIEPMSVRLGYETTRLLGVRVDDVPIESIVAEVCSAVLERRRLLVLNVNANMLMLARQNAWLNDFLGGADLVFCDGAGIQLASLILRRRNLHRTTPPEWVGAAAQKLAAANSSVFWLGGAPGVVERAARNFEAQTGLRTAGTQHGFFDHEPGSADNRQIIAEINRTSPDLLFVNMGMPLQERWLATYWPALNARVAITAGALVDHAAGRVSRPPRWVANCGLEWAVRLAIEPRRLWRRYLLGLPSFGLAVLSELIATTLDHPTAEPSEHS